MKTFIVKLEFSDRNPKVIEVRANNASNAIKMVKKNYCTVVYTKVKEKIVCLAESAFGGIRINVEPNPWYDSEIIINDERFALHIPINYWDITTICFSGIKK